jgi:signal transduction histidine kinase
MAPRAAKRAPSWAAHPPAAAFVVVAAVAVCAFAVTAIALASPPVERFARAVFEALIVGVPLATGVYALRSRRTVWFGLMLLGAGFVWSFTALGESSDSLAYSVGRVSAWFVFPFLIYLILAFPEGRLGTADSRLYAAITALILVLFVGSAPFVEAYPEHTPWASCTTDCPPNAFLVLDSEPAFMDVVMPLRELISLVLLAGVTVSIVRRYRAAPRVQRHVTGPVVLMGVVSAVLLVVYLAVRRVDTNGAAVEPLGWAWSLTIPAVAAAFLVGLVRARIAVGEVLGGLSRALSHQLDRRQLRSTLATLLGDPSVQVLVPDELPGRWRDTADRLTSGSTVASDDRVFTTIDGGDGPVAALVHDRAIPDDEELLTAVRALVLATVQHERLMHRLASSLTELDVSRKRIARAADLERSRIERDLHDGAQQRLIALRIKLSLAEELAHADPVAAVEAIHELGDDVELALEELRSLAHGVYPSLLGDRGIADALRSILADSMLPVHLETHGLTRLAPELETAVYFTCVEAAQNAVKHAGGATSLWVSLRQDDALRFEVRDDGSGFEPRDDDFNGGLRNMRDRVEAMGGRLTIESAPGRGTRIRGVVPLA